MSGPVAGAEPERTLSQTGRNASCRLAGTCDFVDRREADRGRQDTRYCASSRRGGKDERELPCHDRQRRRSFAPRRTSGPSRGAKPHLRYDPVKNFQPGKNKRRLVLPKAANNPVGTIWIELSTPIFGIDGTPHEDDHGSGAIVSFPAGCKQTNGRARDRSTHSSDSRPRRVQALDCWDLFKAASLGRLRPRRVVECRAAQVQPER